MARRAYNRRAVLAAFFGPYKVGDYVLEGAAFFGQVFRAGPRRCYVVWESGQVTNHVQDYRGFRRAGEGCWHGDTAYEARTKARLAQELEGVHKRYAKWRAESTMKRRKT